MKVGPAEKILWVGKYVPNALVAGGLMGLSSLGMRLVEPYAAEMLEYEPDGPLAYGVTGSLVGATNIAGSMLTEKIGVTNFDGYNVAVSKGRVGQFAVGFASSIAGQMVGDYVAKKME